MSLTDDVIVLVPARDILARLDRIEQYIAEKIAAPKLIAQKEAVSLLGGTKAHFRRLVASGEITVYDFGDDENPADPLYDPINILAVRERHRRKNPGV